MSRSPACSSKEEMTTRSIRSRSPCSNVTTRRAARPRWSATFEPTFSTCCARPLAEISQSQLAWTSSTERSNRAPSAHSMDNSASRLSSCCTGTWRLERTALREAIHGSASRTQRDRAPDCSASDSSRRRFRTLRYRPRPGFATNPGTSSCGGTTQPSRRCS